jgi:hypothetical protein
MRSDIRCDLHAQLRVGTAWHVFDALLLLVGAPPSALTGGVAIRLLLIIARTPSSAPDARGCTELLMHYRKFFALCRQAHADRIGSDRSGRMLSPALRCSARLHCAALRYAALPFDSIRLSCASAVPTLCAVLCGAVAQPWSAVAEKRTD